MSDNDPVNTEAHDNGLDAIPSITPEREDIDNRRGRRHMASRSSKALDSRLGSMEQAGQTFARTAMTINLLIASFAVALACMVYLFMQLQQTRQSLVAATVRVEQLEMRLVTTDTTLTKSEVLLAAKLKAMDGLIEGNRSEIRKLWGVAEKNSKTIQAQNVEVQQQKPILQNVTDLAQKTADKVVAESAQLKIVDSSVKEAVQRMEIVQESLSELSADARLLKDKQSRLENDIGKRVITLEDTAKSTDVFRRNTLDELRRLREELSRQQTQAEAGIKPAL